MAYHYTAIGDSLTTGAGALLGDGFAPIYRRMAERYLRKPVSYENLGINGLTSQELLSLIHSNSLFRSAIGRAELITVTIGGNDLRPYVSALARGSGSSGSSVSQALKHTKEHVRQIVHALYRIKHGQREPFIIRMVGLYNPFPGVREGGLYVRQYNSFLDSLGGPNYRVANIYPAFEGNERALLSLDRVHPNSRGYRVIAEELNQLGYAPLR